MLAAWITGAGLPTRPAEEADDPLPLSPVQDIVGQEVIDELRITTDEIWHVGEGSIEGVMAQERPAMILARVAMGEAPESINDRIFVMWLIRLRSELGYKNGRHRGWDPPDDRWGPRTSIRHEALCREGCQFSPVRATHGIYFPANIKAGSVLRGMVYPTDNQIGDFLVTLQAADWIATAPLVAFPQALRGYDGFRSPTIDWIGTIYHDGGLKSARFFSGGNIWRDEDEVDNVFWDRVAAGDCTSGSPGGTCLPDPVHGPMR